LANTGNAQRKNIEKVKISMNLQEKPLAQFFEEVESKTDFKFTYTDNFIDLNHPVTVEENNTSLYDVLVAVSMQTHLNFVQVNENIHVKPVTGNKGNPVEVAQQQEVTVSGKVIDDNGEPLPGATITVVGTMTGTITDIEGNYSITVPDGSVLVFSFIGYEAMQVPVDNRSQIDVTLKTDMSSLEEVVVVGYGTQRKSDITGSLSSLSSEDFNPGIQSSVDQMIQGRAAGVQITQASSEPGGGVSIRIRGSASLTAGNEPLYVIDGLPLDNSPASPGYAITGNQAPRNPLNSLNPGDIESIEILKDASATAIYGSRGANGVILITTKKGKKGAISVNYSGNFGTQEVARSLNVLKAPDYMSFLNDLRTAQGQPVEFTQQEISAIGQGTDWQNEIFRSAPVQNHQVSLSGGSDNTQYYASLNYFDQEGVVISSGTKRYSTKLNLTHSLNKFNFGLNLNSAFVKDTYVPHGVSINESAGVINTAIYQDPTLSILDGSGRFVQSDIVNLENPVGLARGVFDESGTNRTFGNIFAEYAIFGNLKAKINLGSDRQTSRRDTYVSRNTLSGAQTGGRAIVQTSENFNDLMEFTLNFEKQFNENHRINAVGGYTYQVFTERELNAGANNFINDALSTNNLAAGDRTNYSVGTFRSKNQLQSYLGRVNYAVYDKYLLTASFRVDGSSRFGENNKYGYFPSFALGWRIGEEDFISNLNLFSDLKLRTSYGITGNQEIGNYRSLVLLGLAGQAVFNESLIVGIAPTQFANPNLKWETTSQFNVGIDFEFLEGRISGAADYFQKKTTDLLLNLPIPSTTGFRTSLQNVGSTSNSGFELMLTSENITGKFNWSSSVNISTVRNQVTNLGGLPFIIQGGAGFASEISILRVGDPINAYYGYVVKGVFQSKEEIVGSAQPGSRPGELKYQDTNEDNLITPDDRVILGSPIPDFTFGLNNTIRYMGFDLSIFFQGVYGNEMFNFNTVEAENPISFRRNRSENVLDRWTPSNLTNDHPSYIPPAVTYGNAVNSRAVEDASYLRLKNVRLGYSFPHLKSKHINSLSVFVIGQNLLTITNYTGYDPEVSAFGTSNIRADYNAYPLAKIYTMGINIGLK
jgi:TonB-linked SusC/RagA family outer membrane protein